MDKFIVRISAILSNIYIPIVLYYALNGVDISDYDYIFSSTFLLGFILSVLSHSQGKYHCKWMRALCYNATAVPTLNFVDAKLYIFDDAITYVYVVSIMWSVSVISTLILAINHFRKVRKLKKQRYKEYAVRFRK